GGGIYNAGFVFSIDTGGNWFKHILDFGGNISNGAAPEGSLVLSGTVLYGINQVGGTEQGGVIFATDSNGSWSSVLFNLNADSGWNSEGSLILSGKTFYGMTSNGGTNNEG